MEVHTEALTCTQRGFFTGRRARGVKRQIIQRQTFVSNLYIPWGALNYLEVGSYNCSTTSTNSQPLSDPMSSVPSATTAQISAGAWVDGMRHCGGCAGSHCRQHAWHACGHTSATVAPAGTGQSAAPRSKPQGIRRTLTNIVQLTPILASDPSASSTQAPPPDRTPSLRSGPNASPAAVFAAQSAFSAT